MTSRSSPTSLQSASVPFVFPDVDALAQAAAEISAQILTRAIAERGSARVLVATGNSQLALIDRLTAMKLPWDRVDAFHLDEYVGIHDRHPASFRHWIRTRFAAKVHPRSMEYIIGDTRDPDAEALRYAQLLLKGPIDLAFVGFGENGHIAFNDPHVADFNDPQIMKRVQLDAACRAQQVREGHFPNAGSVPAEALTVSCSGLMRASHWICSVPELRKADAVQRALEGPLTTDCPASLVRTHPNAFVFLDSESASKLSPKTAVRRV